MNELLRSLRQLWRVPILALYLGLRPFGLRSRSEPHQSIATHPKRKDARPVVLLGFARTGTTTVQKTISETFGYNASFEFIGRNHSGYPDELFADLNLYFRGAPEIAYLPLYRLAGGVLASLASLEDGSTVERIQGKLKAYLAHLLDHYGSNVVLKELRLVANMPTLRKVLADLGVRPVFVFTVTDPMLPLYTHYRLGGLVEGSDLRELRVDENYAYRRETYAALGLFQDVLDIPCRNKWERLLAAVILDQRFLARCAEQYPDECIVADVVSGRDWFQSLGDRIECETPRSPQTRVSNPRRYLQDPYFLELFSRFVGPELRRLLGPEVELALADRSWPRGSLRMLVTRARVALLELL